MPFCRRSLKWPDWLILVATDIPETGTTLQTNASIKSHFVVNNYKLDCFADDTGLEVDALEGRPGVYSARYAGENASYEQNVDKLLKELKHWKTVKRVSERLFH